MNQEKLKQWEMSVKILDSKVIEKEKLGSITLAEVFLPGHNKNPDPEIEKSESGSGQQLFLIRCCDCGIINRVFQKWNYTVCRYCGKGIQILDEETEK